MSSYILSLIIWMPLLGAFTLLFFNERQTSGIKIVALIFSLIQLLFSIGLVWRFDPNYGDHLLTSFQFVEKFSWISMSLGSFGSFNIDYHSRGRRYESLVGRTFVLNHSPWGTRLLEVKATGEKLFHVVFIAQHQYRWLLSSP